MTIIAVVNVSGNVGKSTVAAQCMGAYPPAGITPFVYGIESQNADWGADKYYRGTELEEALIHAQVDNADKASIFDVGSTNLESFTSVAKVLGSIVTEDIALWVVPFVFDPKMLKDTRSTIEGLLELKVPAKKIFCVPNRIPSADDGTALGRFATEIRKELKVSFSSKVLFENGILGRDLDGRKIREIAEDTTDYGALMRATSDPAARRDAMNKRVLGELARHAVGNLSAVSASIWKAANGEARV